MRGLPALEKQEQAIDQAIRNALSEDIGDGDVTTVNTIPETASFFGEFIVKEDGVIAGLEVARRVFGQLDPRVAWAGLVQDGDRVRAGQIVARVNGPGRALLTGERVALNFMQRMSGI